MHKYRFTELLCIVCTALFILYSLSDSKDTIVMTASEIAEAICSDECDELISRDRAYVREKLGFDPEIFESFVCYSSDDIMDVCEIFIGVAENNVDSTVIKSIESYTADKYKLYNGYAPEAAAILKNAVIEAEDNIFIFIVSENAESIFSAFNSLA